MAGNISPELDALSCDLLESALDSLAAGEPVLALVACEDAAGERDLRSFEDDLPAACITAARDYVRAAGKTGACRYALVYDGDVEGEDGAFLPALIFEFGEKGDHKAWSGFVLYEGFGTGEDFAWADPQPAGECELLV